MDTSKKTFLFNADWYEVLVDYPSEIRLEVYESFSVVFGDGF